jgi:hypothetical protein
LPVPDEINHATTVFGTKTDQGNGNEAQYYTELPGVPAIA